MMEKQQKRERSVNFTHEETDLLVSLIEQKILIIENKKSDSLTWQEKEKAWKYIETAFNSLSGSVYRNYKHLKLKYEAIKRDIRKKSAMASAEQCKTDGGRTTAPVLTPVEQKVKEMIVLSAEGNESFFDSDTLLPSFDATLLKQIEDENEDSKPPKKKVCLISQEEESPQCKQIKKGPFDKLLKEKIEIAKIQKKILTEELEQKQIQRKILDKELEHKDDIHKLEIQHFLLKIELLKTELVEKQKNIIQ